MSLFASMDSHTLWQVALGMGAVVIVVVIVLMTFLLSLIKDIEASSEVLLRTADELAENTGAIATLAVTPGVLEEIRTEALIHYDYLADQVAAR